MINSISFGSTYKVKVADNPDISRYYGVIDFCNTMKIPHVEVLSKDFSKSSHTIIAPDDKDKYVETYLANKGIIFHKMNSDSLMNPRNIQNRVKPAPMGKYKVNLDVEKFEELIKNSENNYEHCKSNYDNYYKGMLETFIKSGEPISTATLALVPKIVDFDGFIDNYGKDFVDKDMIDVDFNMSEITEDSSMYFALKDAGLTKIPVYVDKETFKIGEMLDIFSV